MQKIDKKQLPQLVGLCVLSTGTFGYFALRMMTPSPAAAATRPVLKPVIPAASPAPKAADAAADVTVAAVVPPPAPGMRDPFVVGYTEPKAASPKAMGFASAAPPAFTAPPHGGPAPAAGPQVASAQIHEIAPAPLSGLTMPGFPAAPPAPALPSGVSALPPQKVLPLPAPPPAPPKWSVTGLLQGEDGGGIAVLRDGESRCIVHVGDFVDGTFRVVSVSRSAVVLRHGAAFYTLALGTKPEAPAAPAVPTTPAVPSLPAAPEAPASLLPHQSQAVPARRLQTTVASALPLRLLDGTEMAADAAPKQQIASLIH